VYVCVYERRWEASQGGAQHPNAVAGAVSWGGGGGGGGARATLVLVFFIVTLSDHLPANVYATVPSLSVMEPSSLR
jgi:hypothetical protein